MDFDERMRNKTNVCSCFVNQIIQIIFHKDSWAGCRNFYLILLEENQTITLTYQTDSFYFSSSFFLIIEAMQNTLDGT